MAKSIHLGGRRSTLLVALLFVVGFMCVGIVILLPVYEKQLVNIPQAYMNHTIQGKMEINRIIDALQRKQVETNYITDTLQPEVETNIIDALQNNSPEMETDHIDISLHSNSPEVETDHIIDTLQDNHTYIQGKPLEGVTTDFTDNIYFTVKTSATNYRKRLSILMLTWFQTINKNKVAVMLCTFNVMLLHGNQ